MTVTTALRRTLAVLLIASTALPAAAAVPTAKKPSPKPVSVSGPTGQTLTASQAKNLSADSQWITVKGKNYDETIGILVTVCVVPKTGELPTPCGSGIDKLGLSGTSRWISSNPPIYGKALAEPFGIGGTFNLRLKVTPFAGDQDCRKVKCGIFTRGDMMNLDKRSADVYIPVTFKPAGK